MRRIHAQKLIPATAASDRPRRGRRQTARAALWLLVLALSPLGVMATLAAAAMPAAAATISGDYLEARTADVYTGPCFANSEVNLVGKEAIVAWRVERGAWRGVPVDGFSVMVAVRASATLGDPFASPLPARSLIVVDERANPAQREALVAFARSMAGDLLGSVVATIDAPIELAVGRPAPSGEASATAGPLAAAAPGEEHHASHPPLAAGEASLRAGDLVELRTRGLNHGDHLCGNEEVYYPPLAATTDAVPAATLAYDFRATGLGMTWSSPGKRNAFVGHFAQ